MNESEKCSDKEVVEGTIRSVVYHNDENGYTVLHVEIPSEFELAKNPEITIVGKAQAVWEGEEVKAEGQWVTDKVHGRQFKAETLTCIAPRSLKGIEKYNPEAEIIIANRQYVFKNEKLLPKVDVLICDECH